MGRVFSQGLYEKFENLSKYNIIYVVRQMVREKICKTPVEALQMLEHHDIDVDGLLERAVSGTMPEVSTNDDEAEDQTRGSEEEVQRLSGQPDQSKDS
tara:strand:- start:296 stop:589 length:294 start_codon:yes stop_codon:yes gene_type:complete